MAIDIDMGNSVVSWPDVSLGAPAAAAFVPRRSIYPQLLAHAIPLLLILLALT